MDHSSVSGPHQAGVTGENVNEKLNSLITGPNMRPGARTGKFENSASALTAPPDWPIVPAMHGLNAICGICLEIIS
jgi:hypothetical protein